METFDIDMRMVQEVQRVSSQIGIPPMQLLIETKAVSGLVDYLLEYFLDFILDKIKEEFDILDLATDEELREWAWANDFEERR